MTQEKIQVPSGIDPTSWEWARHTRNLLQEKGLSYASFGGRMGWKKSQSELNRTLNLGLGASQNREWAFTFAKIVSAYFGLRPDQLAGDQPSSLIAEMNDRRTWIASNDPAKVVLRKLGEHEDDADTIFAICFSVPPLSFFDDRVQRAWVRYTVAEAGSRTNVKRIKSAYNGITEARRNAYKGGHLAHIRPRVIVTKSCFEETFLGDPANLICSRSMRAECLEYVRKDCIRDLGLRLGIVDEARLSPDILMLKKAVDAFAIIGKTLAIRKVAGDHRVKWSEEQVDICTALRVANETARCVDFAATEKMLEDYQRQLD